MTKHGEKGAKVQVRRKISGTMRVFKSARHSKKRCAITGSVLHGVGHGKTISQTRAMSKTEKRPSVAFGGILSASARKQVFEESAAIKSGEKKLSDVNLSYRKYVSQALEIMK